MSAPTDHEIELAKRVLDATATLNACMDACHEAGLRVDIHEESVLMICKKWPAPMIRVDVYKELYG